MDAVVRGTGDFSRRVATAYINPITYKRTRHWRFPRDAKSRRYSSPPTDGRLRPSAVPVEEGGRGGKRGEEGGRRIKGREEEGRGGKSYTGRCALQIRTRTRVPEIT